MKSFTTLTVLLIVLNSGIVCEAGDTFVDPPIYTGPAPRLETFLPVLDVYPLPSDLEERLESNTTETVCVSPCREAPVANTTFELLASTTEPEAKSISLNEVLTAVDADVHEPVEEPTSWKLYAGIVIAVVCIAAAVFDA